ncbi:DUF4253 domain-containing protein [Cohnella suwonensis]|uniref:DUF4253 domain-containing protein n=1 Tax=Cohnella suwonensis TaxID=696072 RepID=A0ABW0LRF2_9BACL
MDWKKFFRFGKNKSDTLNEELVYEMGFSHDAIDIFKQVSNNNYQRLTIKNLDDKGEKDVDGISFSTSNEQAEKIIIELKSKLNPLGCLVFISEQENNRSKIGAIKGNDQFDILKIQQTNGDNYDIGNEDVIDTLKKWNSRYPFDIIGADFDWVEANFKVLPSDKEIKSFAKEIYDFCPDVVEQGAGDIESLIEEIKNSKKLYLWWD